jgi:hypothetical protein
MGYVREIFGTPKYARRTISRSSEERRHYQWLSVTAVPSFRNSVRSASSQCPQMDRASNVSGFSNLHISPV